MANFVIKNSELISAAGDYNTAKEEYDAAVQNLITAMESVSSSLNGEVQAEWETVKEKTKTELGNITTNLGYNNSLLASVADQASQAQAKIKSAISNVYGG